MLLSMKPTLPSGRTLGDCWPQTLEWVILKGARTNLCAPWVRPAGVRLMWIGPPGMALVGPHALGPSLGRSGAGRWRPLHIPGVTPPIVALGGCGVNVCCVPAGHRQSPSGPGEPACLMAAGRGGRGVYWTFSCEAHAWVQFPFRVVGPAGCEAAPPRRDRPPPRRRSRPAPPRVR